MGIDYRPFGGHLFLSHCCRASLSLSQQPQEQLHRLVGIFVIILMVQVLLNDSKSIVGRKRRRVLLRAACHAPNSTFFDFQREDEQVVIARSNRVFCTQSKVSGRIH